MNPRRERFKQAMSRLDPAGDPQKALKAGLYVEPPGQTLAAQLLARLELRPQSSHVLAGPSGAGKTTELRLLATRLENSDEFKPIFVDATAEGTTVSRPGQLIQRVRQAVQALTVERTENTGAAVLLAILAALATASAPQTPRDQAAESRKQIAAMRGQIAGLKRKPVLLLDSLDRLPLEHFRQVCEGDLAALREVVAVVVVAPPAIMYGAARELVDQFNYFLRQPTYNPARGTKTHDFLVQILHQRAGDGLIPDESCAVLVEASGGILRDLIALAQLALEEAYVAGHEKVELDDVHRAVDTFGRKHIIGLDSRELDALRGLHKTGKFVRVTDRDTSLLITRRVLEYADERGTPRFAIHPTLLPLLEQLEDR